MYQLTPREFDNYLQGVIKSKETDVKTLAFLLRDVEFAVVSPHLDKKHKNLTPQKYKPFVWEKEKVSEPVKPKSKKELQAIWNKIDKEKENGKTD